MGAGAATAHSSACNAEITKSDFKNPSKTFFSQEKISLCTRGNTRACAITRRAGTSNDEVVRTVARRSRGGRHSRARERDRKISRDARAKSEWSELETAASQA